MRCALFYSNRAGPPQPPVWGGAAPNGTVRGTRSAGTGQQAGASRRRALIGPRRGHFLRLGTLPSPDGSAAATEPGGAGSGQGRRAECSGSARSLLTPETALQRSERGRWGRGALESDFASFPRHFEARL